MKKKPLLLWLNCTSRPEMPELRRTAMDSFDVVGARLDEARTAIPAAKPKALCFDFDYPDRARLAGMQAIKRAHMHLPVLMLTVEHSESLAIWAFRMPVWNYLVKPVSISELHDNLEAVRQIVGCERRLGRAVCLRELAVPLVVPDRRRDEPGMALLPAVSLIAQHYNTRLSADRVARACGMTRFAFSRQFHATLGLTFQDYLLRFRVSEACRLLENASASVTDVGCAVGFNDPSHFARVFRRYTGFLPSAYLHAAIRPTPASIHPSMQPGVLPLTVEGHSEEPEEDLSATG